MEIIIQYSPMMKFVISFSLMDCVLIQITSFTRNIESPLTVIVIINSNEKHRFQHRTFTPYTSVALTTFL